MKQTLLLIAVFGFAHSGRLDSKYLPAHQQRGHVANQVPYSNSQASAHSRNQQAYSGNQNIAAPLQYSGPINKEANDVPVLRLDNNNDGETYNYALETGSGITAQEEGDARGDGTKARGEFSYTAPDGQHIQVTYSSDENGFLAQGSHIPIAPAVPEEILKALEQNSADEARGIFDDGQYREDGAGQYRNDGAGQYRNDGAGQSRNDGAGQYSGDDAANYKTTGIVYINGAAGKYNSAPPYQYTTASSTKYNTQASFQNNQEGYKY